jgi:glycerophosphoryl diester phosphodiesterase
MTIRSLPRLIAHRGAATHGPENTLAAMREGAQRGARWVEFDVRLSGDGIPVIHHDETLDRTTNGAGEVRSKTLQALQALDAGSWFDPAFKGEPVPSLEEMLALCRSLNLGMNVEIKPSPGQEAETTLEALRCLERSGRTDDILISSFKADSLAAARDAAPEIPRGMLYGALPIDWRAQVQDLGCSSIHPSQRLLDGPESVDAFQSAGLLVLVYTVNDRRRADELLSWGADAIITDDLAVMAGI